MITEGKKKKSRKRKKEGEEGESISSSLKYASFIPESGSSPQREGRGGGGVCKRFQIAAGGEERGKKKKKTRHRYPYILLSIPCRRCGKGRKKPEKKNAERKGEGKRRKADVSAITFAVLPLLS